MVAEGHVKSVSKAETNDDNSDNEATAQSKHTYFD